MRLSEDLGNQGIRQHDQRFRMVVVRAFACARGCGWVWRSGSLCSHAFSQRKQDPVHGGVDYVIKEGESRWRTPIKVGANWVLTTPPGNPNPQYAIHNTQYAIGIPISFHISFRPWIAPATSRHIGDKILYLVKHCVCRGRCRGKLQGWYMIIKVQAYGI